MFLSNRSILIVALSAALFTALPVAYACAEHETQAPNLEPAAGEELQPESHVGDDGHDHGAASAPSSEAPSVPVAADANADHHESLGLKRVEPKQICMMNNKFMGTDQIPVEIEGKTYYGCCPMCAGKLKADASLRIGTDPISGNAVDKAAAVLGAAPDGTIYYFENEENMETFSSDPSHYIQPVSIEP